MTASVTEKEKTLPTIRPWRRTGREFDCTVCSKRFYRRASQIARGIIKTCGSRACISASMQGENNPFWGKDHTDEVRANIKASRLNHSKKRTRMAPPKGYKHTPEARTAIKEALKQRWATNRDKMLAQFAHLVKDKPRNEQRYRYCFTKWQRKNWTGTQCVWCDATDQLVLDHIIPVSCGGKNKQENAQTLCQTCNLWKMTYVDRPLVLAGLGNQ